MDNDQAPAAASSTTEPSAPPAAEPAAAQPWYATAPGFERLPEESRQWLANKNYADFGVAIESARLTERTVGAPPERVAVLPDNVTEADPDKLLPIYDKLGRPRDVSGYEPIPEKTDASDPMFQRVASVAHGAGLTQRQWRELQPVVVEAIEARDAQRAELQDAAVRDWIQKNQADVPAVKQVFSAAGVDEDAIEHIASHPGGMAAIVKIARMMNPAEGSSMSISSPASSAGVASIDAQLVQLRQDPAFNSDNEKVRQPILERIARLHEEKRRIVGDTPR